MLYKLFAVLAYVVLPPAAFVSGYRLTERVFRAELVPFPFEAYGLAIGIAFFCWTLAILSLFVRFSKK